VTGGGRRSRRHLGPRWATRYHPRRRRPVNRRALVVLLSVLAAALAVTLWLVAELRTAAGSSGPPPATATAPR
jgi:hypothetical protein